MHFINTGDAVGREENYIVDDFDYIEYVQPADDNDEMGSTLIQEDYSLLLVPGPFGAEDASGKASPIISPYFNCPKGCNIIQGTDADDILIGTEGCDCIYGGAGNDIIFSLGINYTINYIFCAIG